MTRVENIDESILIKAEELIQLDAEVRLWQSKIPKSYSIL